MLEGKKIVTRVIHKPARKVLIKRAIAAKDYFAYCEEVGCEVWGFLMSIRSISQEPVGLWLPEAYIKPNTSEYVQGVELPPDYNESIPEGMAMIELGEADYMLFQGEPFLENEYCEAIEGVQAAIKKYHPQPLGYKWDPINPRIQLEPIGERGYIEMVPVKGITC